MDILTYLENKKKKVASSSVQKTATPVPFIEDIKPGINYLSGWVGSVNSNGALVPEAGAYIYVYLNGFLINPPDINKDGTFKIKENTIISDSTGHWVTTSFFFDVFSETSYGHRITFRAKAPLKEISDRSVPYAIGSTPTPINLGVVGDNGVFRTPYEGENHIVGDISYYFNNKTTAPNFDCNTKIYVYINDTHVGSNGTLIGEVFKNEIRGYNAHFPIPNENLEGKIFSFLVDSVQVDIPFTGIPYADYAYLIGQKNGLNVVFTFKLPVANIKFKLYKNGIRQFEGNDYTYSLDPLTRIGTVTFSTAPKKIDKLIIVYVYNTDAVLEQPLPGTYDGVNNTFTFPAEVDTETLEVYKNGLHLSSTDATDYYISNGQIIFKPNNIPAVTDRFNIDYEVYGGNQMSFKLNLIGNRDGVNDTFLIYPTYSNVSYPQVYKNGVLQTRNVSANDINDYDLVGNKVKFNPWAIPTADDKIYAYQYSKILALDQIITYLNSTSQFKDNCITAEIFNTKYVDNKLTIDDLTKLNDYQYSFNPPNPSESSFSIKIFKNGLRLKKFISSSIPYDYQLQPNNIIEFTELVNPNDTMNIIINYNTTDFVVGEVPSGTKNGVNTNFTIPFIPKPNSVQVYKNGIRLNPLNNYDYIVGSNIITFQTAPTAQDIIFVDYEIAYSKNNIIVTMQATGVTDGQNIIFSYPFKYTGMPLAIFKNGQLQIPNRDYILNKNTILFITEEGIPRAGDVIIIDINLESVYRNPSGNQLKIASPYTLDIINPQDSTIRALFGDLIELYPGKDEQGQFRFWFRQKTGNFKWSWFDPITKLTYFFKRGMQLSARAWNTTPFVYEVKK